MAKPIECKSEMGITIGLIDAIISISNVLAVRLDAINDAMRLGERGDEYQPIRNALTDLCASSNARAVILGHDEAASALIHRAAELVQTTASERATILGLLGYQADGSDLTAEEEGADGKHLVAHDAYYELEGALIDLDRTGADKICIDTIRRVQAQIAAVVRYAKDPAHPFNEASPGGICHMGHNWEYEPTLGDTIWRKCARCGEQSRG